MTDELKPLPFSHYSTRIIGYRQEEAKFRGFIGCSLVQFQSAPIYHEFRCDSTSETPGSAMNAAAILFDKLKFEEDLISER